MRLARESISGRCLGDFVVGQKIGEGGFGSVFRAEQRLLGREAVIKVLQTHHEASEEAVQRFLREAKLASAIDHPYSAHVYAFGIEPDGLLWIAMELVRGTPLDRLLRAHGPFSLDRFVPLLERICEVVHTAHQQGIVHRDLKPANVMVLSRAGRLLPKILDLGIARVIIDEFVRREPGLDGEVEGRAALDNGADPHAGFGGKIVGSPPYMAPEQWVDPTQVDARTDEYALGVLTYEALTGRIPFDGPSVVAIARAHAQKPPPSLPPSFPAGLDAVLARAMAKSPADRYENVLELAADVRLVAGLRAEPIRLPRLDEDLLAKWLAYAPQPLAETLASFDASRHAHHARDTLARVVDATVHLVGLLALAGRLRGGDGGGLDGEALAEALRAIRRGRLAPEDWLDLARELVRPYASHREAFPIPELVAFFFASDAETSSGHAQALEALLGTESPLRREGRGEEEVAEQIRRALPDVARVLRSLGFLCDYPLVVARDGRLERWTGVRRGARALLGTSSTRLAEGEPLLCDADGRPVLPLTPLVQITPPADGQPDEMFLVAGKAGKGRRGACLVTIPHGFERHDELLWERLYGEALRETPEPADDAGAETGSPYPGLAPFAVGASRFFVGREREVEAFLNQLRVQPLLVVVGASGAGKSSFVQAGVIPALPEGWGAEVLRPGPAPLAALAARFAPTGEARALRRRLAAEPEAFGEVLRAARPGLTTLLVIDQFEELFTQCTDEEERETFAAALAGAARSAEAPVRVVLTLRDDFLVSAERLRPMHDRLARGLVFLNTPPPASLLRILVEPTRRAGYELEDTQLAEQMIDAVRGAPSALALLSFTAAKLWERRDRHSRLITRKEYEALGGVGGALARHADAVLAAMAPDEQRLARDAFRRLITAEGARAAMRRDELEQILAAAAEPLRAQLVLERLIAARLLVTAEGADGEDRIEIVHETLLTEWPRLVEWHREHAASARLRDQLRASARLWEERGHPRGVLWRHETLAEYLSWRESYDGTLSGLEKAFAGASVSDAARGRARNAFVVTTIAVLALLLVVQLSARRVPIDREAVAGSAATRGRAGGYGLGLAWFDGDGTWAALTKNPGRAFAGAVAAYRRGVADPMLRFIVAQSARGLASAPLVFQGHKRRIWSARFGPEGSRVITASADGTARVWDAGSGQTSFVLEGHQGEVVDAEIGPDGLRAVTASMDGTARLWDLRDGHLVAVLDGQGAALRRARFSADGRRLVTAGDDGVARVWDARTGSPLAALRDEGAALFDARFSPDGTRLVTTGAGRAAALWDLGAGKKIAALGGPRDEVLAVAFSPSGVRVATGGRDGELRLWDGANGRAMAAFRGHEGPILDLGYDPAGRQLATAGADHTARIWDPASGTSLVTLSGHSDAVASATFSPDGTRLLTTSLDGTAKLWRAADRTLLDTFTSHDGGLSPGGFDRSGQRVVTGALDGTARVWRAEPRAGMGWLSLDDPGTLSVQLSRDGKLAVTAGVDGRVAVWDVATGALRWSVATTAAHAMARLDPTATRLVVADGPQAVILDIASGARLLTLAGHGVDVTLAEFTPDGRRVLTSSGDSSVSVWDAATGRPELTLDADARISPSPEGRGRRH